MATRVPDFESSLQALRQQLATLEFAHIASLDRLTATIADLRSARSLEAAVHQLWCLEEEPWVHLREEVLAKGESVLDPCQVKLTGESKSLNNGECVRGEKVKTMLVTRDPLEDENCSHRVRFAAGVASSVRSSAFPSSTPLHIHALSPDPATLQAEDTIPSKNDCDKDQQLAEDSPEQVQRDTTMPSNYDSKGTAEGNLEGGTKRSQSLGPLRSASQSSAQLEVFKESMAAAFKEVAEKRKRESVLASIMGRTYSVPPDHSRCSILRVVASPAFELIVTLAIFINSITMTIQVETQAHAMEASKVLDSLDYLFVVFFSLELGLRMCAYQKHFFSGNDYMWNLFDLGLVLLGISDMAVEIVGHGSHLRNAKALKMLRVLRLVRVFRFFKQLAALFSMVMNSLKQLLWAMILTSIIIFIVALTMTSAASEWLRSRTDDYTLPFDSSSEVQHVYKFFGTVARSCNTLFQMILGGISWGEVTDLSTYISPWFTTILLLYVAFAQIAVLNVFTGVFVDEALENKKRQIDVQIEQRLQDRKHFQQQVSDFFSIIDIDGDGTISLREIQHMLQDEAVNAYFDILGFDTRNSAKFFSLLDSDDSGCIGITEFFEGCERMTGVAKGLDMQMILNEIFRTKTLVKGLARRETCKIEDSDHFDSVPPTSLSHFKEHSGTEDLAASLGMTMSMTRT
eukprot:TRINITY_DN31376_c0_g1_i1.p1 TRINITY_DN31376_c0_g1~~TRINITY_DN31376_c0_g1_i1.p1  ORF type:complete len:685 (+),score=118.42 TRINITY_DN31376_c0_g1_i1:22-2076(+)